MNFISFNILILMIKMGFEQINSGVEFTVIMLTILNHFYLLDIEINSSIMIFIPIITIISVISVFQVFTYEKKILNIDFNITL